MIFTKVRKNWKKNDTVDWVCIGHNVLSGNHIETLWWPGKVPRRVKSVCRAQHLLLLTAWVASCKTRPGGACLGLSSGEISEASEAARPWYEWAVRQRGDIQYISQHAGTSKQETLYLVNHSDYLNHGNCSLHCSLHLREAPGEDNTEKFPASNWQELFRLEIRSRP